MGIANSISKRKPVYGVGITDAEYCIQPRVNGEHTSCPFYACWIAMLRRCYSKKFQDRRPTYIGCKVCDEWHSFIAFKSWMELQDWRGKQLDKDLIGDGKLYSPHNCVFVSQALNVFFLDSGATRGDYPIGVCWNTQKGKFMATIRVNGKRKHLGLFISAVQAHEAWRKVKLELADAFLANETNPRVRYAIECGITKLQSGSCKGAT